MPTKTLTDAQKEFITANYKKMKHQEIADEIGVTAGAVQRYCYYNRLYKTAAKYKPPPSILPCTRVEKAFERVKARLISI